METSVTTSTGSSSGSATKLPPTSSKLISKNNLELISKNNLTKEISSAVVVVVPSNNNNKTTQDIGNVVLDDTNKEVKNTLSGERIHGLPNETLTGKYTRHQHYM